MSARFSIALALILGLAAFVALLASRAGDAPTTIRIGIASRSGHELLQLAQEKDLFAREGAHVRVVEFPAVGDARRAYARGQIDGLAATLSDLALLQSTASRAPVGFAVIDQSRGGDVLLARPEFSDLAALRGRRIGLEPGSGGGLLLARALEAAGLDIGDVTRVPLDPADAPRALEAGAVDAVVSHAPASVEIEQRGSGHVLFSSDQMPGEIVDLLLIDPAILEARPEELDGIVRALERAGRRIAVRPTDAYRAMGRSERLSAGEMREALEAGFERVPIAAQAPLLAPGGPLARSLESAARALRASGELAADVRLDGALTPAIVERAGRG